MLQIIDIVVIGVQDVNLLLEKVAIRDLLFKDLDHLDQSKKLLMLRHLALKVSTESHQRCDRAQN